jgi:hypothetical protein
MLIGFTRERGSAIRKPRPTVAPVTTRIRRFSAVHSGVATRYLNAQNPAAMRGFGYQAGMPPTRIELVHAV